MSFALMSFAPMNFALMNLAPLLAVTFSLAPQQSTPGAPPPAPPVQQRTVEDPLLAKDLAILAKLDLPFDSPKSFKDASAREIVDAVRKATGVDVAVDRQVFGDADGWEFVRLDCEASTPRAALDAVAKALDGPTRAVDLDMAAGLVILTSPSRLGRLAAIRHYDLRPLLQRRDMRDSSVDERMREIVDFICETVDPEIWNENGGDGGWTKTLDTTLVVSVSPARHQRIMKCLAALEAALPSPTILWQVRAVEISNEVPIEDLRVVLDSSSQLDVLLAANGARIVAAPKLLSPRREPSSVKVGTGSDSVEVSIEPLDRGMTFSVEVRETRLGMTRSLMLRALDGIRSAGILESNGRRLLVEVVGGVPPSDETPARPAAGK